MFIEIEAIVENAGKGAALNASPTTASEDERREANGIWLRKMVLVISAEPSARNEKLVSCSKAVDVMSRCDVQEYCERAILHAVDAHMSKLEVAHNTLFPEIDAFPDDELTGASQRDILIEELRAILFESADPAKFHHPYVPPTKGKLGFKSWWRHEVAGQDPFMRSLMNLRAAAEAKTSK